MTPKREITLEELFEIDPEIIGSRAFSLWTDLTYNRIKWHGWSSFLGKMSHDDLKVLSEKYFNYYSYLNVGQEHIYTQLPAKTFCFVRQSAPTLFVRGALWSNGAVWEEIHQERGRNLTLMVDKLTLESFELPDPEFSDTERLIELRNIGTEQ